MYCSMYSCKTLHSFERIKFENRTLPSVFVTKIGRLISSIKVNKLLSLILYVFDLLPQCEQERYMIHNLYLR